MSQFNAQLALATDNDFSPGDLLFYRGSPGDVLDKGIQLAEGSPNAFVHVAIAISKLQKIEAALPVVQIAPINGRSVNGVFRFSRAAMPYDPTALAGALAWLQAQVGHLYGYGDAISDVLYKLEHVVNLTFSERNCSDLAYSFLIRAGGCEKYLEHLGDPHTTMPQPLADALGVK